MNASLSPLDQQPTSDSRRHRGPLRPPHLHSLRKRHGRRLSAFVFRAVDIFIVVYITVLTASVALPHTLRETSLGEDLPLAVGAFVLLRLLRSLGLYRFGRREWLISHLWRTWVAIVLGLACVIGVNWLFDGAGPSLRESLAWTSLIGISLSMLHLTWWLIVRRWRARGWLTPNLVIVGATNEAEELIEDAMTSADMHVLGIFDDRLERSPGAILGVPVLGDTNELLSHKITPFVDLIVVAVDPAATTRVSSIITRLSVLPNPVTLIVNPHTPTERAAAIDQLAEAPLAPLTTAVSLDRRAFAKRLQDLAIGIPTLILISPLLALIALAVRLDSPGPIFFRQRRHGFNNEVIVVWKFRTMRQESSDARAERQVTADDERVTRVGRILRKASLDELPQLFNVIHGEMSLVGPRPHAIGMKTGDVESSRLVAEYAHRHRIKPGMTGWAAIKGSRGPLTVPAEVSRRVALDVDYIDHQTFWLDVQIMLLTVPGLLGDHESVR